MASQKSLLSPFTSWWIRLWNVGYLLWNKVLRSWRRMWLWAIGSLPNGLKGVMVPPSSLNVELRLMAVVPVARQFLQHSCWTAWVSWGCLLMDNLCVHLHNLDHSIMIMTVLSAFIYLGEGDHSMLWWQALLQHCTLWWPARTHNIYVIRSPCQFDPALPYLSGMPLVGNWHVNLFQPRIFQLGDSNMKGYIISDYFWHI